MEAKIVRATLIKSLNGRLSSHRQCVIGLGIRRMHQSVNVVLTPENQGMLDKVSYMLKVEEVR